MELQLVSSESLPKGSVISMNTGPSRQTLIDGNSRVTWQTAGQAFELKVSPWPLQIDVYSRLAKSAAGAEIGRLDEYDCCKVALHSDNGTKLGIKFRVTQVKPIARTSDSIYDKSAAYFKKHDLKEFFQRILALLASERPDDPYQALAKYVRDAADTESKSGAQHIPSGAGLNAGDVASSGKSRELVSRRHKSPTKTGQSGKCLETILENPTKDQGTKANIGGTILGDRKHIMQDDADDEDDDDAVTGGRALPSRTDSPSKSIAEQRNSSLPSSTDSPPRSAAEQYISPAATLSGPKDYRLEPLGKPMPQTERTSCDDSPSIAEQNNSSAARIATLSGPKDYRLEPLGKPMPQTETTSCDDSPSIAEQHQSSAAHIATLSDPKYCRLEQLGKPMPQTERTPFDDILDRFSNRSRPDDLFAHVASETEQMIAEMRAEVGHRQRLAAVSGNLQDPPDLHLGADEAMNHHMHANHRQFWLQQAHELWQRSRGAREAEKSSAAEADGCSRHPQSFVPSTISEHHSRETHSFMEEPHPQNTSEHALQESPRLSRFIPTCGSAVNYFDNDIVAPESPGLQEFIPHQSANPRTFDRDIVAPENPGLQEFNPHESADPLTASQRYFGTPRLSCFMPEI